MDFIFVSWYNYASVLYVRASIVAVRIVLDACMHIQQLHYLPAVNL